MRVFVQMRTFSIEADNIKLDILKNVERIKDQELQMNIVLSI